MPSPILNPITIPHILKSRTQVVQLERVLPHTLLQPRIIYTTLYKFHIIRILLWGKSAFRPYTWKSIWWYVVLSRYSNANIGMKKICSDNISNDGFNRCSPFLSIDWKYAWSGELGLMLESRVGPQPSTANRNDSKSNGSGDNARHDQTTPLILHNLTPTVGIRQVLIREGNPNPAEVANLRSYYGPDEEQYYTGGEDFLQQFNDATALTFKQPSQKMAAFRAKMAGPAEVGIINLPLLQPLLGRN